MWDFIVATIEPIRLFLTSKRNVYNTNVILILVICLKDILIELASELKEFGSYFESNKKQIETFFRLSLARSRDLIGLFLFLPTNEFK